MVDKSEVLGSSHRKFREWKGSNVGIGDSSIIRCYIIRESGSRLVEQNGLGEIVDNSLAEENDPSD